MVLGSSPRRPTRDSQGCARPYRNRGIAQQVEQRSPKPRAEGSIPSAPAMSVTTFVVYIFGPVVQLVRTLACHARGRRFKSDPGRQFAAIAQSVERILGKDEVSSSNLLSSSRKVLKSRGFRAFFVFLGELYIERPFTQEEFPTAFQQAVMARIHHCRR